MMRYRRFTVRNFKGIKETTIEITNFAGASIFCFVGLNESGKTTLLEAIHSFNPDKATNQLLGGTDQALGVPIRSRVPRHLLSSFNDSVVVEATLSFNDKDKEKVRNTLRQKGIEVDLNSYGDEITFVRSQFFKRGDHDASYFSLSIWPQIRTKSQRKWREADAGDERVAIRDAILLFAPTIAYFPTFVFNFPEKIYLTDRGDRVDKFFAQVFQDILDYEGSGFDVAKDIVARIRAEDKKTSWVDFFSLWTTQDHRDKIQHIMDRAGAAITRLVFGSWNDIFGEATAGKSVEITFEAAEGEKKDASGVLVKTKEHDIWIKFQVRDGTRRFSVNDRSLGFRWFFAFMLFTQFRVARSSGQPILFLFDEPAANLHASAQQKLLESFPKIARGDHCLIYTTHSHYLIDPNWLEQTYIVTNRSDTPSNDLLSDTSLDDESLDVKAQTYRSFVARNPNQTSYFQPILDRINFLPSRFDLNRRSLIVEGKSDYYIISYAAKLLDFRDFSIVPALGAGTISPLVSLHLGWGLDFFFLLDSDRKGEEQRDRHVKEYIVSPKRILMLGDLSKGATDIESLIDTNTRSKIQLQLNLPKAPDKAALRRFFQERLAAGDVVGLTSEFEQTFRALFSMLSKLDVDT